MKTGCGIVTLLTDFGPGMYCAAMKGVILNVAAYVRIVDVCHTVSPQNITEAAFVLRSVAGNFPPGTVHCVVVDPGVGTSRRIILAEGGDYLFLAPDNGVLTLSLETFGAGRAWSVENDAFFRKPVSRTFHGRDIFAPVAAELAAGARPEAFGPEIDAEAMVKHLLPEPVVGRNEIEGHLVFIDGFGNLVSNISEKELSAIGPHDELAVEFQGHRLAGISATYGDARRGEALALIGSLGLLEIAVARGSAAARFPAAEGDRIVVRRAP